MIELTKFSNGLTVVTDNRTSVRSASVGFWIGAGSAFESADDNGISHFTEHVMFKGTEKYSAREIAEKFEDYGANFNAFTSKEATCYYFKCIDENTENCFGLLSHILYESVFDDEELDKERKVIVEEINMVEDEPEDLCYDVLAQKIYAGTALEKTILGPVSNVLSFKSVDVKNFVKKMYTPDNTVIAFTGNITHDEAVKLTEKYVLPLCGNGNCKKIYAPRVFGGGFGKYEKDFEQVNAAIAFPSLEFDNEMSAIQSVVSFCFGTGMSSRLFQRLREQLGLVYNVYTSASSYKNNGVFGIYLNTSGKNTEKAIVAVKEELDRLIGSGLTEKEIARAKTQLKSSMLFGMENILTMMTACGKYALYTGKAYDIEKSVREIEQVDETGVRSYCEKYLVATAASMAYVGKKSYISGKDIFGRFTE